MTITPLGVEVEPEVYWRKAGSSGPISGVRQSPPGSGSRASVASQSAAASSGTGPEWPPHRAATAEVVSTSRAPVSAVIDAQPRLRPVRPGRIGGNGDRARVEAAEEGGDEFQPGGIEQERRLSPRAPLLERRGDRPRPAVQLLEAQGLRLPAGAVQEEIGGARGALPGPPAENVDQVSRNGRGGTGARLHGGNPEPHRSPFTPRPRSPAGGGKCCGRAPAGTGGRTRDRCRSRSRRKTAAWISRNRSFGTAGSQ